MSGRDSKDRKAVILFDDDVWATFSEVPPDEVPPHLSLPTVLGFPPDQLMQVRYKDSECPVFAPPLDVMTMLTTATIASILECNGFEPLIFSMKALVNGEIGLGSLKLENVVAMGISTTIPKKLSAVRYIADCAKRMLPSMPLIIGGSSATLDPLAFTGTAADFILIGDVEVGLPQLLQCLLKGEPYESVPNLYWRRADGQWRNNPRSYGFDWEGMPPPRWDRFNGGKWPEVVFYEINRGCPFKCSFCSHQKLSPRILWKSAKKMADDFCYYASKGVQHILIFDSSALTPLARAREFTKLLIDRGSPVYWSS